MPPLENIPYEQLGRGQAAARWPWRMFSFIFFIVFIVVAAYFGLQFGYGPYLKNKIANLDAELADLSSQIPEKDQESFVTFYSQLVNVQRVLNNHTMSSPVFAFLERTTHARVLFTTFDLNVNDRRVNLEGVAASYQVLSEQLNEFGKATEVEKYLVSESQIVEGRVRFRLILFFTPKFFSIQ